MAVVQQPLSREQIRSVAGVLDYYYLRNKTHVVRAWPRKSNLSPTPAQKAQRDAYGKASTWIGQTPPEMRAMYRSQVIAQEMTWVDWVKRCQTYNAKSGPLLAHPIITILSKFWNPTFQRWETKLQVTGLTGPLPNAVWVYGIPVDPAYAWPPFTHREIKQYRGKRIRNVSSPPLDPIQGYRHTNGPGPAFPWPSRWQRIALFVARTNLTAPHWPQSPFFMLES